MHGCRAACPEPPGEGKPGATHGSLREKLPLPEPRGLELGDLGRCQHLTSKVAHHLTYKMNTYFFLEHDIWSYGANKISVCSKQSPGSPAAWRGGKKKERRKKPSRFQSPSVALGIYSSSFTFSSCQDLCCCLAGVLIST